MFVPKPLFRLLTDKTEEEGFHRTFKTTIIHQKFSYANVGMSIYFLVSRLQEAFFHAKTRTFSSATPKQIRTPLDTTNKHENSLYTTKKYKGSLQRCD